MEYDQLHMVAAVSKENGLEGYIIYQDHINSTMFLKIIKKIKKFG